ncbi:ABC transporter permease [Thomasclavelia sp.]
MALTCIMITFTLSDSLQYQIQKQLNNIFPNQLVSLQNVNKKGLTYNDLLDLKNNQDITYLYGEMRDFEFIGISLQKNYNIDKTIYISDMTKELKKDQLEVGRNVKSDYEIVLSKTTAIHLKHDYNKLLNQYVYGYYLQEESIKKVKLKVVGINGENTIFDTIYINELANVKHVSECFNVNIDQIYFSVGMINIDNKVDVNNSLKKLKKKYSNLEFKIAGENISSKINNFLLLTQRVLILFSSLAVVAACFLIGEVLYLSVVQKTKDIGIFKCLGASKLQLRLLVLFESFILISIAFLVSYLSFYQLIGFINQVIKEGLQLNLSQSFIQIDNYLLGLIYFGALFFGIISSYFPARFASNLDPVKALKYQRY